jgi:ECF sigma factor
MDLAGSAEVTGLLKAWSSGDQAALDRLTSLVHRELHRIARRYMRNERPGNTLRKTRRPLPPPLAGNVVRFAYRSRRYVRRSCGSSGNPSNSR